MTYVPLHAAAVYAGADPSLGPRLRNAVVRVGQRLDVDTTRLPDGIALTDWWDSCQQLWARARTGDVAGCTWVRTRRVLVDARQSTTKGAKTDLIAEYAALNAAGAARDLVEELTSAEPDLGRCRVLAAAAGGTIRTGGDTDLIGTLVLSGTQLHPDALGGPLWAGEVLRNVSVGVRHAAWRDRRVRRLARVVVSVDELWAGLPDHDPRR